MLPDALQGLERHGPGDRQDRKGKNETLDLRRSASASGLGSSFLRHAWRTRRGPAPGAPRFL